MAKPVITKRTVKAAALTYAELDQNFQNLADATVSLTAGTAGTQVISDLNGNITLVAGTGITLTGDNTAKTLTITNASLGANAFGKIVVAGQSDVDADSTSDTLTLVAGTGIVLTTDDTTDTITIAGTGAAGTGNVSSGVAGRLAFYPSTGNTVDDTSAISINSSNGRVDLGADLDLKGFTIRSTSSNIKVSDDINFPSGAGPFVPGSGTLLCRGGIIKLQYTSDPGLELAGAIDNQQPNSTTISGYLKITINGATRFIALYT
jgi:hypothetical protein